MSSVVAEIFPPSGFLTCFPEVDVGDIPGSDNTAAFLIFSGMLVAVVIFQVLLFRILRWF